MAEPLVETRPSAQYAVGVAMGEWHADPAQQGALVELDRIHDQVLAADDSDAKPLRKLLSRLRPPAPVRGLYLWGGVGRGKTFLTELLFEHIPVASKRRLHFHRFMADVHARLRALHEVRDPLRFVARDLADEARLLVLDECIVTDIGDAMLLGHLLELLFARGLTLVATSNIAPKDLYKDGLQRAQFLPAIAAIERNCAVVQLDGVQDYRLLHLRQAATWCVPADAACEERLRASFEKLAMGLPRLPTTLEVEGRPIVARAHADGIVWFDFGALCEGPRAVADYIDIARDFHTVLVSNVPVFDRQSEDAAKRFVLLVDEFYDRHVNLLASAAAAPMALYRGHRHAAEFARTESRLIDMQSDDYLALEHRP
ncbi:MAG TPA: cell division protein ZapE [Xanthomonadaceae bacterium]|jgi:cell division protein ZapE|nr:cell division protein ZapE [Xanthomonadaceae bacterium]